MHFRGPAMLTAAVVLASGAAGQSAPAFRVGIELPSQVPVSPAVENALRDMGIGYVNFYVSNAPELEPPEGEVRAAMMDLCERLGLDFSIACHHRDPAPETVSAAVARPGDRFEGVVFDELAHIRLMNPHFAPLSEDALLADADSFTGLEDAYEKTLGGFRALRGRFEDLGAPRVVATHVWPEFLHLAARAGFTPCPKVQKEFYSSVSLAIGMGAAKQYGRDLWVDADLWYFHLVPGHPPEEMWCNLLLAYWLGADLVYLEGAGYNLLPAGRQGTPFSLVNQIMPERYQLTPHGETLKRFCRAYLPEHPRPWTFRDVRPTAAIVRFEDGDHGQASWGAGGLYGTDRLKPDADTGAWLRLWNVLTHGATGDDGLAWFKGSAPHPASDPRHHTEVTPSQATDAAALDHTFFVPLNGVIVYDHLAGYDLLTDVPLLFLTGKDVSDTTRDAIARCVEEGAVCVAWGPLARRSGLAEWEGGVQVETRGRGRLVVTDDFAAPKAVAEYEAFLGAPDEIRYRFGEHRVTLRKVTGNTVEVSVE